MIAAHDFYENAYAQFWVSDSILYFKYKPNLILDLQVAKQVVADRISFQDERIFPILCDVRGIINSEKAGRDYLAHSGSLLTSAVGILVHEKVALAMSAFYLEISQPSVPTKIFKNEIEALEFLSTYKLKK